MVYESDFYTTRRPYSSRPYVSSYSVTPILDGPFYLYNPRVIVRTIPHIPYVGHRKLVSIVHTPVRIYHSGTYLPIKIHSRVRPSIIAAELNRIRYLSRPSSKSYLEDYLQSRDYIDFDDEAKDIRARTDKLLRKVHVYVPRPTLSDYEGETIPERLRSDDYVRRIINAKNARKDIESLPWYSTPAKRDIGPGHLACIKYAGGRAQPKRKPYYTVSDLVPGDVKTDVKLMSYYSKNRKAAEDASPAPTTVTWADEVNHEEEMPEQPVKRMEESVAQAKVESEVEPEVEAKVVQPEQETVTMSVPPEPEIVTIPLKKKKEKKVKIESNNDVDMEAECDEDGVKKVPDDDTIQKVQEYLNKKAAEKKLEEEKRAFEAAERKRIAAEKETARLAALMEEEAKRNAEMIEAEKREQERQEIIRKAEEAKAETERLKEDEKLFNEAVAQAIQDELERVAKEDEENRKRQEEDEEREDSKIAGAESSSDIVVEEQHSEEHSAPAELSDPEVGAKPYEVDNDEVTQIEEDEPEEQDVENPFADDEGAAIPADVDEPDADSPKVKERGGCANDEPGFDWSSIDNEPEVEEACVDRQTPQIEEKDEEAGSDQALEEVEVSSQPEADDIQIEEEVREADETQVEETQVTEEAVEETREEEGNETEDEKTPAAQEESDNDEEVAQVTEVEEAKSEDKTSHEVSEEEEEEEEEEE